jgi:Bax protein
MTILLRRLDIIPADLALAQAAMESAWGRSRFAREGNNYFGQWCFSKGCGIVPEKRPAGARYEVQRFDSPAESVAGYMRNLNSHPRYTELRLIREKARAESADISGQQLAGGLHGYSAIGDTYIRTLRVLIRANQFERFEHY